MASVGLLFSGATASSASLSRRAFSRSLARFGAQGGLALAALPWLAGCESGNRPAFKGVDLTGAPYGKGFSLTDMNGVPRTLDDYRGQVVMLYFGFVQCPDVCPTALARAREVMASLGPEQAQRVQVLFVTVDPERDTPELLRDYMAAFDPRFLALRGTEAQTRATADAFKVYYRAVPTGSTYTMDHTAMSYLFDPRGRFRVALRHEQTADDFAHDIGLLLVGA